MKDASRLVRKLRRKVYREVPIATWNRVVEIDWRGSYDSLISTFRRGDCGVLSGGTALALWRAATDAGFRAWCYDFGFPESLTHMVTVIEADDRLQVHDPFLNLGYRADFYEILEGLRADRLPDIRRETRDRKIYIMDPSCEFQLTADWLTAHSDRELDRVGSLRRFEVLWDSNALLATLPRTAAVYQDLETRGYPADLSYLMLHPIEMFDGRAFYQGPETMPLIGGRDLHSPVAGLRAATRQLTQDLMVERDQLAEKSATSGRLESELAEARSQLLSASGETEQLSAQVAQLRAANDDTSRQRVAEQQELSQQNAVLAERHTALETELAEATTCHAAAAEEAQRLADQVVQLRSAYDDAERRIAEEGALFLQQQQKLEAALGETSAREAEIGAQAQGLEQTIRTLQEAADQRIAEWDRERKSSEESAQRLENDKQQLQAEVAETRADLASAHGQLAELRSRLSQVENQLVWSALQIADLVEKDAAALSELARRREEIATLEAEQAWAQTTAAEWRDRLDRRTAEWDDERELLQASVKALDQETGYAFAASAAAQLRAEKAEAQARRLDFQVAELPIVTNELARRQNEAEAAVSGMKRLIGVDDLPIDNLPVAVAHLREHVRKLERELDRAEAERDRQEAEPQQGMARQASPAGRVGRYLRGLLFRRADRRGDLFVMKG